MAITLGQLVIELLANTAGFTSGMNKASYEGKKATKDIEKSFEQMGEKVSGSLSGVLSSLGEFGSIVGEMGKKLTEAFEGVGEAKTSIGATLSVLGGLSVVAIGATSALAALSKEGAEITERLSQVSQKTGISVNQLQVLEAAGGSVGLSLEDMVTAFRKFDQALTQNGKNSNLAQTTLKSLGITAKDNKEALLQAADAFKNMEDGPVKAADAVALFGKSGLSMIPFLNKGREGILEFQDAVDTFGPKITNEGIKNTEEWKVSVEKLSLSWKAFAVTISDEVLPALTKGAEATAGLLRGVSVLSGAALEAGKAALSGDSIQGQVTAYLALRTAQTGANRDEELALQRKNEAIEAYKQHYKEIYELEKAGGKAALEYSQAQEAISAAIQQQDFKTAAKLEETLPTLKAAADAEAARLAAAQRLAATYAAIEAGFAKGAPRPLQKFGPITPNTDLWNQGPANPLEGAPQLAGPQFADLSHAMDGLVHDTTLGKQALDEFNQQWRDNTRGTVKAINDDYDGQLAHFQGLLALGQISEEQAKDVFLKIQQERFEGLKRLRAENGTSTFADAWQDTFGKLAASGRDFARSITDDIGGAIQDLNQQLAKFAVTGQGLNLKQIGQSFGENAVSSLLKKGESGLFSQLGGLFGLNSTKPDGSSAQAALWVQFATGGNALAAAGAGGIGSLPLGNWNPVNIVGTAGNSNVGSALSSLGSAVGSAFKSVGSFFGGFLAGGGDTQPGKAYIVGEKRPELFVPGQAGRVVPNVPTSSGNIQHITLQQTIVTPDADSFKRSQGQVAAQTAGMLSRGASRIGR
jgi:hypothetical protein